LIAALVLPPVIAVQYRRWSDDYIWIALQEAKRRRDDALVAWRIAYDDGNSATPERADEAETQYNSARQDVESAVKALYSRYGNSERAIVAARHRRK